MPENYKTIVVSTNGLRIKGDDTSVELSAIIDKRSNEMSEKGVEITFSNPSLMVLRRHSLN